MTKRQVPIHVHTTLSNDTYFDSTVNFEDYLKKAKEMNLDSIAFTEHGNVFQWIKKKQVADKLGIKYIHGCEFYMSFDLEKQERQNFHISLYAKNIEGVRELNKLSSKSFIGKGEKWYPGIQYYYRPRISFEQLCATSKNILVSTACLASPLWKLHGKHECDKYTEWLVENKDRCFLEVQPHVRSEDQKTYNELLISFSKKTGIRIIAGTDTHVLNKEDNRLRAVLQAGKKDTGEAGEEDFELHMRTYDELFEEFQQQGILSDGEIFEAINNTCVLSDMCDNWELDFSHKYPKISNDPEKELWNRILKGIEDKRINDFEPEKRKKYLDAIKFEYDTYVKLGNCDYFVLLDDMVKFCRDNNIATSPRGSCNGSQSLWVLDITDVDPIKYGTLFFRFMNPERISLADVDIDMAGAKRPLVKDYLYNREGLQCSAIVTFSKLALRGACRLVAKGLGYDLETENLVAKEIEEKKIENEDETTTVISTFHNEEKWREKYPEWIELTYKAVGIITGTSTHACGFVTYDGEINEEIGTFRNKDSKWVISQNDMKAIDSVNFVKMDLLSVDNIQIVGDTEKDTGVALHNDDLDLDDINVWNEMLKSGLGIFQFEKSGWFSLRRALENFEDFVKNNPSVNRFFIMLALNGVIRPSCSSFREDFLQGIPNDNGHSAINEFFSNMNNYCIFQEQIMLFLEKFCHYTGSQSDSVRRGIAKKGGTDAFVPEIREKFMKHFIEDYGATEEESILAIDKFVQIIIDSSDYGFSINHSTPYTLLGFKNAYYRCYYPLQYLCNQLNVNDGKFEKTQNITDFIKEHTDIKIQSIKFGKSTSRYTFDLEENTIYKGMASIKDIGVKNGEELFELRDNTYESLTRLLHDITAKTSVNQSQVKILIKLDFFSDFGMAKKLLDIADMFYFKKQYSKKTMKKDSMIFPEELVAKHSAKETEKQYSGVDFVSVIEEIENTLEDVDLSIKDKIDVQSKHLGYINFTDPSMDKRYTLVTRLDTKYSPRFVGYCLNNGGTVDLKIKNKPKSKFYAKKEITYFQDAPFKNGDMIYINKFSKEHKRKKTDDGWIDLPETEWWALNYTKIE